MGSLSRKMLIRVKERSSLHDSRARYPALPSTKSSLGCSLSTTPLVPARHVMASAPQCISTPHWWYRTIVKALRRGRSHPGQTVPPHIIARHWKASQNTTALVCGHPFRNCQTMSGGPSSMAAEKTKSPCHTMMACAPTARQRHSKASFPTWSAAGVRRIVAGYAKSLKNTKVSILAAAAMAIASNPKH